LKLVQPYAYCSLERITRPDGVRHYIDPDTGKHLPSITTILSQTADHTELLEWRERVGDKKADQTRDDALALGNLMHEHLENHVMGIPRPKGNNYIRLLSRNMSDKIINGGLCHVDEVWGCEVPLYIPGLFAGTTDLVGVYKGVPAILDYKTAKKMKLQSHKVVQDYICQTTAYAMAHNFHYGTNIETCIIFMVDRDLNFDTFVIEGKEFYNAVVRWESRVIQYYNNFACDK